MANAHVSVCLESVWMGGALVSKYLQIRTRVYVCVGVGVSGSVGERGGGGGSCVSMDIVILAGSLCGAVLCVC